MDCDLLSADSIGPSKLTIVAAAIGTSLVAMLFLIGCVLLVCCRKKVFRRHYESKEYAKQCNGMELLFSD